MNHNGMLDPTDLANDRLIEEIRSIVKTSPDGLHFTSRFFVGMDRLSAKIHKPFQAWFQREISVSDAILAARDPRSSGKTSGITKSFPFWLWGQDPRPGTPIQGVNTRVGIVAPKKDIASYNFLADIARRFRGQSPGMRAYRKAFPEVQPDPHFWSLRHGLLLRRTEEGGEPSLMPVGMESIATSAHFHILFIDDPIHEQNYQSEVLVRQCVEWMYHSQALVRPERGARGFIGNFWRKGDVQDQLRPENPRFKGVKVWERGMTGCPECVDNRFPLDTPARDDNPPILHECGADRFPVALQDVVEGEDGARLLIDPPVSLIDATREALPAYIHMTQNENRPVSAATLHLRREWIKFYSWHYEPSGELVLLVPVEVKTATTAIREGSGTFINKHNSGGTQERIPLSECDGYILIDPAPSETSAEGHARFAFVVVARHRRSPRTFLIEEYAKNAKNHLHIHAILDSYERWKVSMPIRRIAYESVAYQATIRDTLLTTAREVRHIITLRESMIEPLPRLRTEAAQEDRIKYALIPIMEAGNLYISREHRLFLGEVDSFGIAGAVRDLLDALSNGPRIWGKLGGVGSNTSAIVDAARKRRENAGPTGYGG